MIPEVNQQFWRKLKKQLGPTLQQQLIHVSGITATRFFKDRFRKKNWLDATPQPWKPRKRKDTGSLMTKSGRLKRSVRVLKKTRRSVTIGTDVPYAQIHNEGGYIRETVQVKAHSRKRSGRQTRGTGKIHVKSHSRRMNLKVPPRPFLGESKTLAEKIEQKMNEIAGKTLKK